MNKRQIGLGIVLLLIGIAYLVMFTARQEAPLEVMFVEMPGADPMFSFNDEVVFEEIKVIRPGVEPTEGELYIAPEDQVVWHLVPREPTEGEDQAEPTATKLVKYGRGVRGMRRAEGIPRRGVPLEPGVEYRFTATLAEDEGEVDLTFTPKDKG